MTDSNDPIVIAGYARTPMGALQGELAPLAAHELGTAAIAASLNHAGLEKDTVQEVIMGCVLAAGQGQAPARQAALNAGLPQSTGATTINKMCGSGLKAVMFAHDLIAAGSADIMVAGGMESMTNAPYLLDKARGGYRMGHGKVWDHMFLDGLEDAYDKGKLMGVFADDTAARFNISRDDQDEFALRSLNMARNAAEQGKFDNEITPVTIKTRKGEVTIDSDELPRNARPDKIPGLKPAFGPDGTVTAATSSGISDGAAAVVMMRKSEATQRGLTIYAEICAHATSARAPNEFTMAPIGAIEGIFSKTGWSKNDVDLFEINEAFAVVTLAAVKQLDLPVERVNIHGGACALGHPIGASGARILVTLLSALAQNDLKTGIATLCIGGGEAVAVGIRRIT